MPKEITVNIQDETGPLKTVVLGHSTDKNPIKHINNPKYAESLRLGIEPSDDQLLCEIEGFAALLEEEGVKVLRPSNIPACTQIFPRDIGFVIDNTFVVSNMRFENRNCEYSGISNLVEKISRVLQPAPEINIEGGDIVLFKDYVFVGIGQRTSYAGLEYLKNHFSQRQIIPIPLVVTDDPMSNILHLDCAMQPVGHDSAIIYEGGFIEIPETVYDLFPEKKRIIVTQREMYDMMPNIFSISPIKVIIDERFERLAKELKKRDIEPLAIPYIGVSRLGGLLRCSTLPLERYSQSKIDEF